MDDTKQANHELTMQHHQYVLRGETIRKQNELIVSLKRDASLQLDLSRQIQSQIDQVVEAMLATFQTLESADAQEAVKQFRRANIDVIDRFREEIDHLVFRLTETVRQTQSPKAIVSTDPSSPPPGKGVV